MINFIFTSLGTFFIVGLLLQLVLKLNEIYRRERIPNFHEKRVFITGTDTGFGRELALALDKKGLVVYAGCYTEHGGDELRKVASDKLRVLNIDVTKRETLEKARDFIEKELQPDEGLWGLVNNAGLYRGCLIDFCTVDDFRQTMEVNFFGVVTTTEIFIPFIKKARGRIVNVVSLTGRISVGVEPYTCSKHALEPYCDGLRRSMKSFGVHVAAIEPGCHDTKMSSGHTAFEDLERMWTRLTADSKEEYGEEFKKSVEERITKLMSKYLFKGHPSAVADAISHALSSKRPKARYVCGSDAHILIRVLPFVPDWLLDTVARKVIPYDKLAAKVH